MNILKAWYVLAIPLLIIVDRITKLWALHHCEQPLFFVPGISCELTINRGISWGLFQAESALFFGLQTLFIIGIIVLLIIYTTKQLNHGKYCYGNILVIAGGISNSIDRLWYSGVIDFILVYYKHYSFPVFNVADILIVMGIALMISEEIIHG